MYVWLLGLFSAVSGTTWYGRSVEPMIRIVRNESTSIITRHSVIPNTMFMSQDTLTNQDTLLSKVCPDWRGTVCMYMYMHLTVVVWI